MFEDANSEDLFMSCVNGLRVFNDVVNIQDEDEEERGFGIEEALSSESSAFCGV